MKKCAKYNLAVTQRLNSPKVHLYHSFTAVNFKESVKHCISVGVQVGQWQATVGAVHWSGHNVAVGCRLLATDYSVGVCTNAVVLDMSGGVAARFVKETTLHSVPSFVPSQNFAPRNGHLEDPSSKLKQQTATKTRTTPGICGTMIFQHLSCTIDYLYTG